MQMSNDASASGAAQVHSQIHPVGLVIRAQSRFHTLGELHHFVQCSRFAQIQFRNVCVRHDHYVAGGIGEAVQDDKRFFAAMNDKSFRVIVARHGIAKNALRLVSTCRLFHVLVAPRSPDIVHRIGSFFSKLRAQHSAKATYELRTSSCSARAWPEPTYVLSVVLSVKWKRFEPEFFCLRVCLYSAPAGVAWASALFTKSFNSLLGLKK